MIRSELVARIAAKNPHLYEHEVEAMVSSILDRIAHALTEGNRVEIRGFGVFETKQREARIGRNPQSGAVVEVPPKTKVTFKTSKGMRARLNRAEVDPGQEVARFVRDS